VHPIIVETGRKPTILPAFARSRSSARHFSHEEICQNCIQFAITAALGHHIFRENLPQNAPPPVLCIQILRERGIMATVHTPCRCSGWEEIASSQATGIAVPRRQTQEEACPGAAAQM
jgi:hypothetical protein